MGSVGFRQKRPDGAQLHPKSVPPLTSGVRISNDVRRYQSVPDEQHHDGADNGGDETSTLIWTVPADGLTDPSGKKPDFDAEQRRELRRLDALS
jgi:hypothetical protein